MVMLIQCSILVSNANSMHYFSKLFAPCLHKIKTGIIIPSIQNQNSLLVKWQNDSIIPGGGGWVDREVRRLVPSSHKISECRHKSILQVHPDSLRGKAN